MDDVTPPRAAETLPASWYRDPARLPLERERVFARSWLFMTHESAIGEIGDWAAETIAGYPILIVRGKDGGLKGFHNVCRHRAAPLTKGSTGHCADGLLTCQYHGWRYALDGRLRIARDFGPAHDFDPRALSLFPVKLAVWRGLVFVALSDDVAPLEDLIAPIEARLGATDWRGLRLVDRRAHHLECNWKTYVENYLEGYHIPNMHPSLDAQIDCTTYQVAVEGRTVFQDCAGRGEGGVYQGLFPWVWPNLAINCYSYGLMVERMTPIGPRQTRLDYFYLMPDGSQVSEATMAMSEVVTGEDKWIVERVQENLDAGVYETGRLSPRHEPGVAAFQAWLRAATEGA